MKRILFLLCLAVALWQTPTLAEEAAHEGKGGHEEKSSHETLWKVVNFAILAGALGYLIGKNSPAFFAGRTAEIRKGLDEAAKAKADAEAETLAIRRKLESLEAEIAALRAGARTEMEAEGERVRAESARQLAKINDYAQQEIESAGKTARQQLKQTAAALALELAEEQVRAGMTPAAEERLLDAFTDDLRRNKKSRPEVQ